MAEFRSICSWIERVNDKGGCSAVNNDRRTGKNACKSYAELVVNSEWVLDCVGHWKILGVESLRRKLFFSWMASAATGKAPAEPLISPFHRYQPQHFRAFFIRPFFFEEIRIVELPAALR